jgi:hypothetical protein
MALSATSKTQLNNLLSLLSIDPTLTLALSSSAERLLSPANAATVKGLLARSPNGSIDATASTALTTLVADISAN